MAPTIGTLSKGCLALLAGAIGLGGCADRVDTVRGLPTRPNVLLILADDLAASDLGAFGGEIPTPNLDSLAREGTVLTNFYAAPTCSPTRAMLLTGVDNHLAGLGNMAELMAPNQAGRPGYEGHLNDRVVTLAELLSAKGYRTSMAGKWHLGLAPSEDPSRRGFDRSFTMLMGGASHFSDMGGPTIDQQRAIYRRDGKLVQELPGDFFSTTAYTDETIRYIDEGRGSGRPFFSYLAYTAPHWPVQAPARLIQEFSGDYDAGYEALRAGRLARQKQLGLVPPDAPAPRSAFAKPWSSLSPEQKREQARLMEIYAAMVAGLDEAVGRLLGHLTKTGELDDTLIIFLSDNGPEGTQFTHRLFAEWSARHDNRAENLGRQGSFATYGPGWAEAGAAAHSGFKAFVSEGGIKVPAIVRLPKHMNVSRRYDGVLSVKDVTPTILDLTGTPWSPLGRTMDAVHRPTGQSFIGVLTDGRERTHARTFAMELFGRRSIRAGDWKAVLQDGPLGSRKWQMFNVAIDPGETRDRSGDMPGMLKELVEQYKTYEEDNGIIYPQGASGY